MVAVHDKYYYRQLVFQVENTLYGLPNTLLCQSTFFSSMLENADTGCDAEGLSDDHPIQLTGITTFEMDSLLMVLRARYAIKTKICRDPLMCLALAFSHIDEQLKLTLEQWSAALHLATMWHFDSARKFVIDKIDAEHAYQDPLERLDLAFRCQVAQRCINCCVSDPILFP